MTRSANNHQLMTWTTFFLQVACVVCAPFVDGDSNTIYLLGNSTIVKREDMKKGFPLGEHFVELLFNLSIRFNAFQLHDTEKALFSALVLISPGRFQFSLFFLFLLSWVIMSPGMYRVYQFLLFCSSDL